MAQFQGIQVLSIKEAVLMQKKKIERRGWSMFFHLFFFFFWSDVKRIPWNSTKHLLAPGGARKSSLQNSPHEMAAFRDLASSPGAEGHVPPFSQQTPLCKVQTLSPILQLKYNSFVTAHASSFMSWNGSVSPWVIGSELNFACANFFTFVWKKNWGD